MILEHVLLIYDLCQRYKRTEMCSGIRLSAICNTKVPVNPYVTEATSTECFPHPVSLFVSFVITRNRLFFYTITTIAGEEWE